MKLYISLIITFVILSCNNQDSKKIKDSNPSKEVDFVEENFQPLDIENYLSGYLIIGKRDALIKNKIRGLNILGHDSYLLNDNGQITKSWNISNNYDEYVYDKNGLIQKIAYKQHTTKKSYVDQIFKYDKKGQPKSVVIKKYDNNSNEIKSETIEDEVGLNQRITIFKRGKEFAPYHIDTTAKIILNYRDDLAFCCGKFMEGKNRLLYYYGENELIDSLIISQMDSTKTMKFEYQYK